MGYWSVVVAAAGVFAVAPVAAAGEEWIRLVDESAQRIVSDPSVGIDDEEEKDFAWGDVDQDGDQDLVVVRTQGWDSSGRRRNVLFMNEGIAEGHALDGVLVDRTAEYASAADDVGSGMLDRTNDRDVVLVDVDNDGWLDVVTATTHSVGQPQTISHPRVYMNLGRGPHGWLGFRYEQARIPLLHPTQTPRFNAVAAGDVTGDGLADLYFGSTASGGGTQIDLGDFLLVNQGGGFFADETEARLTPQMVSSLFVMAVVIGDFNGDGAADILRARLSVVTITWNDPRSPGFFTAYEAPDNGAPTHVIAGDLNADGRLDLLVTDDGSDRYLLNLGNGPDGLADFALFTLPETGGFAGNSAIGDLNDDGLLDLVITDVDFQIPGCSRDTMLLRNTGTPVDPDFVFDPGDLPLAQRTGTHDVAIFNLDGASRLDMILGRCEGLRVLVDRPPPCPADADGDGDADVDDLLAVILDWGTDGSANGGDVDASGGVDVNDLVMVILSWGDC